MRVSVLPLGALAGQVRAAPARLPRTRLVCVDGPSGAGKSALADRLAAALGGCQVVHMDDLYPGWDGLAEAVPLLVSQVLRPLATGQDGAYHRYDWRAGRYAERHEVPVAGALVVEGVGCGARQPATYASLLVWVDAPRDVRFARGIERDGESYRPLWERWAVQEEALFAREGTRGRADVRVDGAPAVTHDPATEVVLLPG